MTAPTTMPEKEYHDEESSLLRPPLPLSRRDDPAKLSICSPTLAVTIIALVFLFLGVAVSTTTGSSSGPSLFDDEQEQQQLLTKKKIMPARMSVPEVYQVEMLGKSREKMKHEKKTSEKEKSQASNVDFSKIDWSQVDYSKVDWSDPNYWANYVAELDEKEEENNDD